MDITRHRSSLIVFILGQKWAYRGPDVASEAYAGRGRIILAIFIILTRLAILGINFVVF